MLALLYFSQPEVVVWDGWRPFLACPYLNLFFLRGGDLRTYLFQHLFVPFCSVQVHFEVIRCTCLKNGMKCGTLSSCSL